MAERLRRGRYLKEKLRGHGMVQCTNQRAKGGLCVLVERIDGDSSKHIHRHFTSCSFQVWYIYI